MISFPFVISMLKPYQKLRILTFINPDRDPLGAGYQIIQSKIAVGSGGLTGKEFLKGTQGYLDFYLKTYRFYFYTIFREFGFVGSVILLILYAFIIIRILIIGSNSRNYFGKFSVMVAISIFLYFSKYVNGFRYAAYRWIASAYNVLWRILNAFYDDSTRNSYEYQVYSREIIN